MSLYKVADFFSQSSFHTVNEKSKVLRQYMFTACSECDELIAQVEEDTYTSHRFTAVAYWLELNKGKEPRAAFGLVLGDVDFHGEWSFLSSSLAKIGGEVRGIFPGKTFLESGRRALEAGETLTFEEHALLAHYEPGLLENMLDNYGVPLENWSPWHEFKTPETYKTFRR